MLGTGTGVMALAARRRGEGGTSEPPYRLMSDQLTWPTGTSVNATAGTLYDIGAKTMQSAPYAITSPRLCFSNMYRASLSAAEQPLAGALLIEAVYIEISGIRTQLTFNGGSASVSFSGGAQSFAWTDENLTISIPAETTYRVIWATRGTSGQPRFGRGCLVIPASQFSSVDGGDVYVKGASSFATNAASGALPTSLPAGAYMETHPVLCVGRGRDPSTPVILGVGDSLWRYHHAYVGWGAPSAKGNYGVGEALNDPTGGRLPYGTVSASSTYLSNLQPTPFANRKLMLAAVGYPFDVIYCNAGRNDVSTDSLGTTQSRALNAWAFLRTLTNGAPKRIVQGTAMPTSAAATSSNYTTVAGQTTDSSNGTRNSFNSWLKGLTPGGVNFDAYIDIAAAVDTGAGKWKVPGGGATATSASLTADISAGATSFQTNTPFAPGAFVSIELGASLDEVIVADVTGSGPYTHNIQNVGNYAGATITKAHLTGATVWDMGSPDGVHPSTQVTHEFMTPKYIAAKVAGIFHGLSTGV